MDIKEIQERHDYARRNQVGKKSSKVLQAAHKDRGELLDKLEAVDELRIAWAGITFVSADKDNMEFNVKITYWQKDTLQAIMEQE